LLLLLLAGEEEVPPAGEGFEHACFAWGGEGGREGVREGRVSNREINGGREGRRGAFFKVRQEEGKGKEGGREGGRGTHVRTISIGRVGEGGREGERHFFESS